MQLLCLLAAAPVSRSWLTPSRRPHTRLQAVVPKVDLENVEEAFAYAAEIREHAPSLFERLETAKPEDALEMLTYAEQLQKATTYLRPSARQAVRYALEVAFLAHRGQTRRSGQPFVTHPVAVASILAETRMDRDAVVSGLLHDTVEDTDMTFQEVEAMFGRDVRGIVEGETKVSKLPKMARELNTPDWDAEREQVETCGACAWQRVEINPSTPSSRRSHGNDVASMAPSSRRSHGTDVASMASNLHAVERTQARERCPRRFVAMAGDWRVVVVKLADRLHNMRTLEFMPPKKRTRIARETLEIFAPLAHRLGIWTYKTELEDAAFRHLSISASRCVETPSRRRRDSCPSHNEVGGFFFDFEAIRTETAMLRAGIPGSTWRWIRLSKVVESGAKPLSSLVASNSRRCCTVMNL